MLATKSPRCAVTPPTAHAQHAAADPLARYRPNPYREALVQPQPRLKPASLDTGDDLRPSSLGNLIGQEALKTAAARASGQLAALELASRAHAADRPAGDRKDTLAMVMVRDLGTRCFVGGFSDARGAGCDRSARRRGARGRCWQRRQIRMTVTVTHDKPTIVPDACIERLYDVLHETTGVALDATWLRHCTIEMNER